MFREAIFFFLFVMVSGGNWGYGHSTELYCPLSTENVPQVPLGMTETIDSPKPYVHIYLW